MTITMTRSIDCWIEPRRIDWELVARWSVSATFWNAGDNRAAVRVGLLESGFGGLLPMIQSEISESGLRDVVGQRVKESWGAKQIRQTSWTRTEVRRQTDDRQPIGHG